MLRIIIFLCTITVSFVQCKKLHEYMTPEEVMGIFHTNHEQVPHYEVVPIKHTAHRRSLEDNQEIQLKAFDRDIKLYLNPTEGILASTRTPVWTVSSDSDYPEGLKYTLIPHAMRNLGHTFHDMNNTASILMNLDANKRLIIDGIIGITNTIIRSIPERILQGLLYNGDNSYEPHHTENVTENDEHAYTYHHVIYQIPEGKKKKYKDFSKFQTAYAAFFNNSILAIGSRFIHNITFAELTNSKKYDSIVKEKRNVPDVIYPEVLIIMDNSEYELVGRNVKHAMRYILSFWNGVDLRYRLLNNPKIRFNIAGIVIALDNDATPYIENNRLEEESLLVDVDKALREMGDYIYRETRFPIGFFDIAITMTQLDLCNMFDDYCDDSTLGYAYVSGACNRQDDNKTSEMASIVEDNGGFSGIIPAAHEVGHLIGARHDGNPKYATNCSADDGFIMTSGLLLNENGFQWSNCSIQAFYTFLNEERAKCLYNKPVRGPPLPRILPGKLMSLDYQCKKVHGHGTRACNPDHTACIRLDCLVPGTTRACTAIAPAAEGSSCGNGVFCLNGKCVLEGSYMKSDDKKSWSKHFDPLFKLQKIVELFG
ncbi:PREDICTED: A disintegrin and metalloproteinase with thrombospondin motifs 1-like isoform X2 [Polistes dominula]|uniref:A disintegrin and metalloproteinase with thrombospondin motifs 1-like isoform X2 n=1 Tax=Polistes dominula TaxID=743375 RepID=A0ABM1IUY9_POLDO|nr:PREDICTED: A disintegrin and metalloproteinase with thrombospondin motifs 1-like isoform X2 [Polistes dominula]